VLLTLQHHYIQSANNYVNFDQLFAPILMVLPCQLHQYIGATDMVYWWNCASSTNREKNTNILKFKNFTDFLNVSTNILVLTGQQHQYIGAVHTESKW
jgi:hypothetical protein